MLVYCRVGVLSCWCIVGLVYCRIGILSCWCIVVLVYIHVLPSPVPLLPLLVVLTCILPPLVPLLRLLVVLTCVLPPLVPLLLPLIVLTCILPPPIPLLPPLAVLTCILPPRVFRINRIVNHFLPLFLHNQQALFFDTRNCNELPESSQRAPRELPVGGPAQEFPPFFSENSD
jgi:hypothetical protein